MPLAIPGPVRSQDPRLSYELVPHAMARLHITNYTSTPTSKRVPYPDPRCSLAWDLYALIYAGSQPLESETPGTGRLALGVINR